MTARDASWPEKRARFIGESITALEPTRDSAERVKVRVGRRVLAVLRARDLGELGLKAGQVLDPAILDAIHDRARFVAAMDGALRLLKSRVRSEAEMRTYLNGRGFDAAQIDSVVARLRELELIDDRAFALEAIDQVQRRMPAGERLMRHVLERHGVEEHTARQAIDEARAQAPPAEQQARALIESRLKALGGLPIEVRARRLMSLLARRGFEEDLCERLIREIVGLED